MEKEQKKALMESLLFVSGTSLGVKDLQKITELPSGEIEYIMNELMADYRDRDGGVHIAEVAEGYQMVSNSEYSPWIKRIKASTPQRLSMAALETLAIVSYRQPLTKAEIDQLRGVSSDGVIKNLLERRLINVVGKKEAPGRPLLYGTTREFLLHFGLKDLSELPTLRELNPEEI
jgi:segregation and condensation protein B